MFTLAIRLVTDTEIRTTRLKEREKQKFGDRIMPGGDMYTHHMEFIEWARKYDTGSVNMRSNLLWAEYSGGDILKGSLIGTVLCNGELDFVYHHMNQNMQIKTGKCHSVPTVQENGKIELSEQWQWTTGDCSKGESLLVEVSHGNQ